MPERMSDEQIDQALEQLPGVHRTGDELQIQAQAPEFLAGIRLVDAVAQVADEMDHHPDIDIRWCTITFVLSTHSEGGITSLDVGLAARVLELASAASATVVEDAAGAGG